MTSYWSAQDGCTEVIAASDQPIRRLQHSRVHDHVTPSSQPQDAASAIDSMFKRKRGRPPQNRVIEVRTTIVELKSY